jgi:amino acid transporter
VDHPAARLEPDAIGVTQDTVLGMATSAPAASLALTLPLLVATVAYGTGPVIILTAIPMLIIANAYRRLNMWNASCGASFEWVGRAINPYLGFFTGWLMIAAYVIATVSGVEVLGPNVLAIFGDSATSTWGNVGIATGLGLVVLVIAVVGIRITARTQVGMAVVEYAILLGLAAAGLVLVLNHHRGTVPVTRGWLSLSGIGGKGDLVGGFLAAVFMFTGWDGTVYVNEEVTRRRVNPGRAAVISVALLAVIYAFSSVGLQGTISAKAMANTSSVLVTTATAIGGSGWAKAMALALALSVVGSTLAGIVVTARIVYGMASYRTLPPVLSSVSPRFATPVWASVVIGLLTIVLTWVYLLATSVQNAFTDVVDESGLLFAVFYVLTALATIVYYRQRLRRPPDLILLGILPLGAAAFLGWMVVKSMLGQGAALNWSIAGVGLAGLVLTLVARYVLRSPFFSIARESELTGLLNRRLRPRSAGSAVRRRSADRRPAAPARSGRACPAAR